MGCPLEAYDELVRKVDAFFTRVLHKYSEHMRCAPGCDDCCRRDLSLYPFEVEKIVRAALRLEPAARARVLERSRLAVADDEAACPLLEDGRCLVYDSRPVICRSHGLPLLVPDSGELSVCALNFTRVPEIDGDCVLDLTPVNQVMAVVNSLVCKQNASDHSRVGVSAALCRALEEGEVT